MTQKQRHQDYMPPPCLAQHETLYEDEHIMVVVKPEGLLSVPGRHMKDSLLSRIKETHPNAAPAHRLDMDTSGVMVVPLSKLARSKLSAQFRERLVKKQYIADVIGNVLPAQGSIDLPIGPDWENRPRNKIDHETGKASLTHYEVIERAPNMQASRLLMTPITGRSHQLRLHTLSLGHEILGCDLYAREEVYRCVERLHLHACQLSFFHPEHGGAMEFKSTAPFQLPVDVRTP